jgi:hypothetical protein
MPSARPSASTSAEGLKRLGFWSILRELTMIFNFGPTPV